MTKKRLKILKAFYRDRKAGLSWVNNVVPGLKGNEKEITTELKYLCGVGFLWSDEYVSHPYIDDIGMASITSAGVHYIEEVAPIHKRIMRGLKWVGRSVIVPIAVSLITSIAIWLITK